MLVWPRWARRRSGRFARSAGGRAGTSARRRGGDPAPGTRRWRGRRRAPRRTRVHFLVRAPGTSVFAWNTSARTISHRKWLMNHRTPFADLVVVAHVDIGSRDTNRNRRPSSQPRPGRARAVGVGQRPGDPGRLVAVEDAGQRRDEAAGSRWGWNRRLHAARHHGATDRGDDQRQLGRQRTPDSPSPRSLGIRRGATWPGWGLARSGSGCCNRSSRRGRDGLRGNLLRTGKGEAVDAALGVRIPPALHAR